jgi:hypothetical protein
VRSDDGTAATVQEFVGIVTRVLSAINAFLDFVYYTVQLTVFLSCLFIASSLTYHLIYKLLIPTDIYASSVPLIYSNASAFGLLDFSSLSAPAPSLSFYCSNPHTVAILNLCVEARRASAGASARVRGRVRASAGASECGCEWASSAFPGSPSSAAASWICSRLQRASGLAPLCSGSGQNLGLSGGDPPNPPCGRRALFRPPPPRCAVCSDVTSCAV